MRPGHLALLSCVLLACDDAGHVAVDARCAPAALADQPRQRFVAGHTFWLDRPAACAETWTLVEAPPGSLNTLVVGEDGHDRFTPLVEGTYRFALPGTERVDAITVVPASERSFHNLNYYPSNSIARVGDALWVADATRPTVTRLAADLEVIDQLPVGPWPVAVAWRSAAPWAVVAQRGGDTLGLIDVAAGRLVDAIWVGDEPSNVVLAPDGQTAYVALATGAAVAVVDLSTRRVTRVSVGPDPLALALSPDGTRLFVASHRSGHPDRFPYDADPEAEEHDITVIDTATLEVVGDFGSVGTTLNGLLATEGRLYVSGLRNDTAANLADPASPSFAHSVIALDPRTGAELAVADLMRQPSSGGPAVSLHGMALHDGLLWVAAEGSDALVGLDPETLAEVRRVDAPGRPRAVLADAEGLLAHGAQGFTISAVGDAPRSVSTGEDPRPEAVARGQRYFTGAGRDYGANWSCNSCHADGLSDTLIWNAGPFESRLLTRPFFWLEGSWPLGWAGYLSSVKNYAYSVNTNIGVRPTTEQATDLAAYIGSIMPPPAANAFTDRDGALSAAAEAARPLFAAKCGGCHALPLTTSRQVLPRGLTEGTSAIPALVGAYRHGAWLKRGEARSLDAAVDAALRYLGETPDPAEVAALTRFLNELTGRDFFVLNQAPRPDALATVDQAFTLTFSLPVHAEPENLARVELQGFDGRVEFTARGRTLIAQPATALEPDQRYAIVLGPGFESEGERPLVGDATIAFRTAPQATLRVEGEYVWTVDMPLPRGDFSGFDPELTAATPVPFTAADGVWTLDYGEGLTYRTEAVVVSGDTLRLPALPIPVGPSFSDSFGAEAQLTDEDGDGIADTAEGMVRISGPGFDVPGVTWRLARPEVGCPEGAMGEPALEVERGDGDFELRWAGDETALGVYVTDPGVRLPLGPGTTVTGGETSWALAAEEFPAGFGGPVQYGVVPEGARDATEENGGPTGGATLEAGRCYQVSVITNRFRTTTFTLVW